ncbi:membrane hypothetical protein [Desulfamplus magnetovallimortis]|uniref:Uncharacterized protein n=1 Tax=Desulfamplus magnetovallimortis TaxID=1246637 RepID=A0A1W1HHY9_9BACT|nr:hypothetical protein [Desulfamplus magnetovallimortis]SLM32035.1 membrane hypothetical protein [Desulfamplus magnetovallimortis]
MLYSLALPLCLISIGLLVTGVIQEKHWRLYLLKLVWLILSIFAAYFAYEAWKGSIYSENWAMIGVIFIVWPISGFIFLSSALEIFLLRKKREYHARINKYLSLFFIIIVLLISFSPFLIEFIS